VAASTIGLLAAIAVVGLSLGGSPVPAQVSVMALLLPGGLGLLLALIVAEARQQR
jgi:hypothetical protein